KGRDLPQTFGLEDGGPSFRLRLWYEAELEGAVGGEADDLRVRPLAGLAGGYELSSGAAAVGNLDVDDQSLAVDCGVPEHLQHSLPRCDLRIDLHLGLAGGQDGAVR